jgi:hypothetical protein
MAQLVECQPSKYKALSPTPTTFARYSTGKRNTKAFGEAMFVSMPAVAQQIHIQRLNPENKGALPYTPLQADYRNEKQSLTHIWLLVISLGISFHCHMTVFRFSFF